MMYGVDPGKMFCDVCKKRIYGKSSVDTGTLPGIVKPKEKPKTNHDLIVDDDATAAAKGMSYGKFKEWQRRQKELKERGENLIDPKRGTTATKLFLADMAASG